jgi:hypothetical protein
MYVTPAAKGESDEKRKNAAKEIAYPEEGYELEILSEPTPTGPAGPTYFAPHGCDPKKVTARFSFEG